MCQVPFLGGSLRITALKLSAKRLQRTFLPICIGMAAAHCQQKQAKTTPHSDPDKTTPSDEEISKNENEKAEKRKETSAITPSSTDSSASELPPQNTPRSANTQDRPNKEGPIATGSQLTFSTTNQGGILIAWSPLADNKTPFDKIEYKLVWAPRVESIDSVSEASAQAGNRVILEWKSGTYSANLNEVSQETQAVALLARDSDNNTILVSVERIPFKASPKKQSSEASSTTATASPSDPKEPIRTAASFDCSYEVAKAGDWSGCYVFLKWRGKFLKRSLNADMNSDAMLDAVWGCGVVLSRAGESNVHATCVSRVLKCVTERWAADNFTCMANGGGFACLDLCRPL